MLHEFVTGNRDELIRRCTVKVSSRFKPAGGVAEAVSQGIPLFLQQLARTLRGEQQTSERAVAGAEAAPAPSEIGRAAAQHGAEMLRQGFSVDQVVHGYGDVCQAITEMAVEQDEAIDADEFRTLNRCLDDAIADAVTSYGSMRQQTIEQQAEALHEKLTAYSVKQRRLIAVAIHAYGAIKTGDIGLNGATGTLLIHALEGLQLLADSAVPEIRLSSAATTLPS
jgi:hypothetical protein